MQQRTDKIPLVPVIIQQNANDDILLYEGPMKLHSAFDLFQKPDAIGKAFYCWFPFPRVTYELRLNECGGMISGDFEIAHEKLEKPSAFYKLSEDPDGNVKGFTDTFETPGKSTDFAVIQFQLANILPICTSIDPCIQNTNQIIFSQDKYSIVLQSSVSLSQITSLEKGRGHILSGIVEIKQEPAHIKPDDSMELIAIFSEFLSFFNGLKVKPVIVNGFSDASLVWQQFLSRPDLQDFIPARSWAPNISNENSLNKTWQVFYGLWENEEDRDSLQLAIHWYLESLSQRSGIEASITLIQNALELLCSRILVEREYILDINSAEKLSASAKINVLLNWAKISNRIPDSLADLNQHAKANTLRTGPEAITYIRNSIVHPHSKNREKYKRLSITLKNQALQLALHYVELIILRLLDYDGSFFNRIGPSNLPIFLKDRVVPWADKTT